MSQGLFSRLFDELVKNDVLESRVESGKAIAFRYTRDTPLLNTTITVSHDQAVRLVQEVESRAGMMHVINEQVSVFDMAYKTRHFAVSVARGETMLTVVITRHSAPARAAAPVQSCETSLNVTPPSPRESAINIAPPASPRESAISIAPPASPRESAISIAPPASPRESAISIAPPEPPLPPPGKERIDHLLSLMVRKGSSDLHLYSGDRPKCRVDGELSPFEHLDFQTHQDLSQSLLAIVPPHLNGEYQEDKELDFSYSLPGLGRFRVNVFNELAGIGGVFRHIPEKILTIEQLGLPAIVREFCDLHKGLILVTGATGSGKSTTLAAMLEHINRTQNRHVVTIEDPIEFVYQSKRCTINQREVGVHTRSFSNALRAVLREDPDIVLVGELRDLETVAMALETAETGHLVFGTLHTNTAASTIDRIIDQFPNDQQAQIRVMLSTSLKGVVAQTLCRRKGKGRVGAFEILNVTPAIGNLIREQKVFQIPSLIQTGRSYGMIAMNDYLAGLVTADTITPEEAVVHSPDRISMRKVLKAMGLELEETQDRE